MNHYQTLGISPKAGLKEIKIAFKRLAFQYHPDKNDGDKGAEEKFKEINEAYKTLSNNALRKAYDDKIKITSSSKVNYVYHEGGFYRSVFNSPTKPITNVPPKVVFQSKKKDIEFYIFWITITMILLLVIVLMFICKTG
jgi:curved DNA-binding protein CbpA